MPIARLYDYALNMDTAAHKIESAPPHASSKWGTALILFLLVFLAVLNPLVPPSAITIHNVLHHLNFLPLMMAGMLYGWRGAALTGLFDGALNAPLIVRHWREFPLDAKDQIVELSIFTMAGLIAGYLSDRERAHRRNLEETRHQLESVYLELRENITKMKQAERLSATGRLAASLAHEIRNPLASISGAAGILRRGAAPREYQEDSLDIIQNESQRLNKLLTGFLNFAKPRSPRLQWMDPDSILASVASLTKPNAVEKRVALRHDSSVACPEIECDPEQLRQVLLNLVLNAIEASPAHSEIQLRTLVLPEQVRIEVEDNGTGIDEEAQDKIFDPFFTTKPKGTGLGLAISSMIVAQHGGTLSFRSNAHGGITFSLELPFHRETPPQPAHDGPHDL